MKPPKKNLRTAMIVEKNSLLAIFLLTIFLPVLTGCEPPLQHTKYRKGKGFLDDPTLCIDQQLTRCITVNGPVVYHAARPEDILNETPSTLLFAIRADTNIEPMPICALNLRLFNLSNVAGLRCGAWIATDDL